MGYPHTPRRFLLLFSLSCRRSRLAGRPMPRSVPPLPDSLRRSAAEPAANPTAAERAAAEALFSATQRLLDRNRRTWPILSQSPLPPYLVDVVCLPRRLLIEIDGPSPHHPAQQDSDQQRPAYFRRAGSRVLRFRHQAIQALPSRCTQRLKPSLLDFMALPSPRVGIP